MDEQMSKTELLATIRAERERLDAILGRLSDEQMTQPGVEIDWSVKDLLAHLTWWEQRMILVLNAASRGEKPPSLLLPGEDWETAIQRLNQEIFAASSDRSLADVRESFRRSFEQVIETVSALSERDLFAPDGLGAVIGRAASHVIAANTYEHYQEHGETIRAWIGVVSGAND